MYTCPRAPCLAGAVLAVLTVLAGPPGGARESAREPHRDGERITGYLTGALPIFWSRLYPRGGETLYCGKRFARDNAGRVNVEHVFPMAWVTRHLRCGRRKQCRERSPRFNRIEADLHNLWPALSEVNEARASFAFAIVQGERHDVPGCDFEVDRRRRQVEPRPAARGEIARSMFYMAEEHGLEIFARQGRLLERWHRDDPVSDEERRRNDLIERIQGNRNPFIDDPGRAARLGF